MLQHARIAVVGVAYLIPHPLTKPDVKLAEGVVWGRDSTRCEETEPRARVQLCCQRAAVILCLQAYARTVKMSGLFVSSLIYR